MTILMGCIADDFTGASDLASVLAQRGMRTIQVIGVPPANFQLSDIDAVVVALNVQGLSIGAEIDPGVPWTETLDEPRIAIALKSGNFGSEDLFDKAIGMLS